MHEEAMCRRLDAPCRVTASPFLREARRQWKPFEPHRLPYGSLYDSEIRDPHPANGMPTRHAAG